MEKQFYIPIQAMNLGHYLDGGIISPSKYIQNKNSDIQDRFENHILLSSRKYTNETNCAIEIVLNPKEESPKKISENFYLFDMPLPISRIKGIYFKTVEQKTQSEFDINSGAAFVPNNLLKIINDDEINADEIDHFENKKIDNEWDDYLRKFDQIMGGFAIMAISKRSYQNYPSHYFKTLGNINFLFDKIINEQNITIENQFEFAFKNIEKYKKFQQTIYSKIDLEIVKEYANKDNLKLEIRNGLIKLDTISEEKKTYFVAILESYGKGKRKQVDSFISDLISGKLTENKKEGLALIFGLNKGYRSFRNKYQTENFETIIKFKLDSQLDYYIIESIYQNVFNNLNDIRSFSYIDDFCVKNQDKINTSGFETYKILDKIIILKKKEDLFPELFHLSSDKRTKIYSSISKKISSWFPKYFKPDLGEIEHFFRDELETSIEEYAFYIHKETIANFEKSKELLENLNNTLMQKDEVIQSLQKQIQEISFNKQEDFLDENLIDEIGDQSENYKSNTNRLGENTEKEISQELRSKELNDKKVSELKMIATNLKISASQLKKEKLVSEILKAELNNDIFR